LVEACAAEVHTDLQPKTADANSWEPAPKTIREILRMKDGMVRQEWLNAIKKELKTLIKSGTFVQNTPKNGEISTPVMETIKVKVKSDGSLDKLKCRLVVRRDLQDKNITEDKWSPTASFCSLKMFLAHASRIKARVKQLDFVGVFLQAKMSTRIFVMIPKIYGILFPEYSAFCGVPVRLVMSINGTTLCGKDLGFKATTTGASAVLAGVYEADQPIPENCKLFLDQMQIPAAITELGPISLDVTLES
jgi:hypothetical protein